MPEDSRALVVTGAAGFIGGRVTQRFAMAGRRVVAVDLSGRSFDHLAEVQAEIRPADLTDAGGLQDALAGVQPAAVVHCAALMGGWGAPAEYRRVNVEGTRNIAAWAAVSGAARFLYISSVSVYGMPASDGIDENAPFRRIGLPYADSKMEAEALVGQFHEAGLASTIVRPGDVYGPRAGEWVVKLVDAMKAGRMILIAGGRGSINATYVDNLVDAIEAALSRPEAAGRDYIITDGAPVTWKVYLAALARAAGCSAPWLSVPAAVAWPAVAVLEAAGRATGRRPPLSRMGLRLLTARCSYSIQRARRELGWSPRVGLDSGMEQVAAWLRSRGRG